MDIKTLRRKEMVSKPKDETCDKLCLSILNLKSELDEIMAEHEGRKKIEKAKWILVKAKGIDEEAAHKLLVSHSRANQKKLAEMAEIIIEGEKILNAEKK